MKLLNSDDAAIVLAMIAGTGSPELREALQAISDGEATVVPNPAKVFGCYCDLDPDAAPDGCVLDEGRPEDCRSAQVLKAKGLDKWSCSDWKVIAIHAV